MTDFLKIAKSIAVHFAHICAYGVETVKVEAGQVSITLLDYTFVNVTVKHWNNTITSNILKAQTNKQGS